MVKLTRLHIISWVVTNYIIIQFEFTSFVESLDSLLSIKFPIYTTKTQLKYSVIVYVYMYRID